MMTLTLDGRPAVLKPGSSFKVVRVNPYFEETKGDYTFEVTLPLAGCADNLKIFGPMHHPSVALAPQVGRRYSMELTAPPLSLSGYAEVKSLNRNEVKVQLVAGAPSLGFSPETGERYIDELDLGHAWDGFPPFEARMGDGGDARIYTPGKSIEEMKELFHDTPFIKEVDVAHMAQGRPTETDCVCFATRYEEVTPTLSVANWWTTEPGSQDQLKGWRLYMGHLPFSSLPDYASCRLCPQPYLLDIAVRIAAAVGYQLDTDAYRGTPAQGLFVVNTRQDIRRARALPHWTVRTFFTELTHLLGAVLTVGAGRMRLTPFRDYYADTARQQEPVLVDTDFSTELDSDPSGSADTVAGSNVGYIFDRDEPMLVLPDEVWEKADQRIWEDWTDLDHWYSHTLTEQQRAASTALHGVRQAGGGIIWYASLHADDTGGYRLHRVNQMGPLIRRQERTVDIELRMRPTAMSGHILHPVPYADAAPPFSVDAFLRPDEQTAGEDTPDRTEDIMELAHYDGRTQSLYDKDWRAWPVGNPYQPDERTGLMEWPDKVIRYGYPADGVFALSTMQPDTLGGFLSPAVQTADTRVEYCFRLADAGLTDPTLPYLIGGKLYACHKLELTLDSGGVSPLVTGYFYELH